MKKPEVKIIATQLLSVIMIKKCHLHCVMTTRMCHTISSTSVIMFSYLSLGFLEFSLLRDGTWLLDNDQTIAVYTGASPTRAH